MDLFEEYGKYCEAKSRGLKKDAGKIVDQIINEFKRSPNYEFILHICNQHFGKINHLIWEQLVLPELETRIESDPRAISAFIKTIDNFYASKQSRDRLSHITKEGLLNRLLKLDPNNKWAREQKILDLTNGLQYAIHEWPSGILCGKDCATHSECDEILDAVEELRNLDDSEKNHRFCDDVKSKTNEYKSRLNNVENRPETGRRHHD